LSNVGPMVSIIIPTFNREFLLKQAIDSVLNQTFDDFEIIIVDNYSTDGTEEMVKKLEDPRLKFAKLERTGSVAASRNLGIRLSQATWIAFLDSDDWWSHDKLEVVSNWFVPNVDLIYHPLQKVFQDTTMKNVRKPKPVKLRKPIYMNLLLYGNNIGLSSVVARKTVLEEVGCMREEPRFWAVEDYDTWLRVAKVTENFKHISKELGFYRVHDSNISSENSFEYVSAALADHLLLLDSNQRKRFDSLYYYKIGRSLYNARDFKDSLPYLIFVLKFGRFDYAFKALISIFLVWIIHPWAGKIVKKDSQL